MITLHVRRPLTLAIGIAGLAAFFFGYRHFSRLPEKAPAAVVTSASYQMLYTRDLRDFGSLTAESGINGSYTLDSALVYDEDGNLLGVNNPNAQPVTLRGQEVFRFSKAAYQMALVAAQNLPYTQTVTDDAADLAIYGLLEPRLTLTLSYRSGGKIIVEVGSRVPSGGSDYVKLKGSGMVCLVPADLYDMLGNGLNALHEVPGASGITPDQVIQLRIEQTGAENIEIAYKPGDERASSVLKRRMYAPFEQDVNPDRLKTLLDGICSFAPAGYAGYAPDTATLERYGLDAPAARIIFQTGGTVLEYRVGQDTEGGKAFVALDRSGDIFTADKAMLAFLDYAKAEYLADQFVSLITVTTVDSVTVDASGETYTLGLTWPADAAEAGRCEAEAYYFQGNSVRKEDFTPLYSGIIGITFDKRSANDALEAEPVARVAFRLNAAPYETTVEYLPYDTHYYAVRSGAGTHFLVRREKVDAMTAMLREAAARLP